MTARLLMATGPCRSSHMSKHGMSVLLLFSTSVQGFRHGEQASEHQHRKDAACNYRPGYWLVTSMSLVNNAPAQILRSHLAASSHHSWLWYSDIPSASWWKDWDQRSTWFGGQSILKWLGINQLSSRSTLSLEDVADHINVSRRDTYLMQQL